MVVQTIFWSLLLFSTFKCLKKNLFLKEIQQLRGSWAPSTITGLLSIYVPRQCSDNRECPAAYHLLHHCPMLYYVIYLFTLIYVNFSFFTNINSKILYAILVQFLILSQIKYVKIYYMLYENITLKFIINNILWIRKINVFQLCFCH